MSDSHTDGVRFGALLEDSESALVLAAVMLLAGLAAGWAGRGLLAGEAPAEQFWLVPVAIGLATSVYAQATGI
jgi:anti-sigma factor RsiW